MFEILLFVHSCIFILSAIVLTFIVNYLKSKFHQRESITTLIQIDLTFLTGLLVASFTIIVFVRESIGPFESDSAVFVVQFINFIIFYSLFFCVLSLQLAYVIFLLKPFLLNELALIKQTLVYRGFVCIAALILGYHDTNQDMNNCGKFPICLYLMTGQQSEIQTLSSSAMNLSNLCFFATLFILQVLIAFYK